MPRLALHHLPQSLFARAKAGEPDDTVDDPALESLAPAALHASARQDQLGDVFEREEMGDAIRVPSPAAPPSPQRADVGRYAGRDCDLPDRADPPRRSARSICSQSFD